MPYLLIRHKVEDYERWKKAFDDDEANRRASGSHGGHLLRDKDDPNLITILLEWDDEDSLRSFMESDTLQERMRSGTVTGEVEMDILDEAARPSM